MVRLAWAGIGALWLSAGMLLVLIMANAEDHSAALPASAEAAPSDGDYTLVAFVSPRTAALLADPPEDSRIAFELVDSAEPPSTGSRHRRSPASFSIARPPVS